MKKTIVLVSFLLSFIIILTGCPDLQNPEDSGNDSQDDTKTTLQNSIDTTSPAETVKPCFIHHSTGSAWISSGSGVLGETLNNNNYYVTECDYGWDAEAEDNLGDRTNTENWPEWFTGTKMPFVYNNSSHYDYTNVLDDPGGENSIIMFKSCYPCSEVGESMEDEKEIYNGLLDYFSDHRDKLFILIIPPPEIEIDSAELTRELACWLADYENGWLKDYQARNVFAFDYYNILTDPENHHRVVESTIVHSVSDNPEDPQHPDELYYYSGSNDHPTAAGHQKATEEFVPLLNALYNYWQE